MPRSSSLITAYSILILLFFRTGFAQVTFTGYTVENGFNGPGGIYACDVDGDDDNDILGAAVDGSQIAWWRNDGGEPVTWTKQIIDGGFIGASFVFAAYVDDDEFMDVLGSAWYGNEIAWWRNNGDDPVTWTKQTIASNFTSAHEVFAIDLDRDGDTDVLGASAGGHEIAWWRNDGGDPIQWTEYTIDGDFTGARSVYAHDMDGDEDNDVLGAALLSNEITLWRNDGGDPIEWTEITIAGNFAGAHMVRVYDMDTDGDPDILGAAYLARDIAWWRNDGGEPITWTQQTIAGNFIGAVTAHASDLDGDLDMDVLGTGQDADEISWWRNDGGLPIVWTKQVINADFAGVWPACVADLNGDDMIDLAAGGFDADEIRWWKNESTVGLTDPESGGTPFPAAFELSQNYPNPFNPSTRIGYTLEEDSRVILKIYNMRGREIRTLVNDRHNTGSYSVVWDGKDDSGRIVSSGMYICRLTVGDFTQSRKIVLLK